MKKLPPLKVGNLIIDPPFILGGMGVRITDHNLVSAVADCGMAGTIASVGLCKTGTKKENYVEESNKALISEIKKTRELTKGIIGINIMVALTNYAELVKTAINENIDYIACGAGLPLDLPRLAKKGKTFLIPIVSSSRAVEIICKRWLKKYDRLPDAIIVEGALAGGHLGFKRDVIFNWNQNNLIAICKDVIQICKQYEEKTGKYIPVIVAGGIFNGEDIARFLKIGIAGIQMATRFITTEECSVPDNFKQVLINSTKEDMMIINSPVGLFGRAIKNKLTKALEKGKKFFVDCPYHCLKTCNPDTTPFCIADALVKAQEGDVENGLIMAGYNAYRIKKIVPVGKLIDELISETLTALVS